MRKTKRKLPDWLSVAISATALVVSLASAIVSTLNFRQTSVYNEIAIRPYIETYGTIFAKENGSIFIFNKGGGSGTIVDVDVKYDGVDTDAKLLDNSFKSYVEKNSQPAEPYRKCTVAFSKFLMGIRIRPSESIPFLISTGQCPANFYMPFLEKVVVVFSYVSDSGNSYQTEFRSVTSLDEVEKYFQ